MSSSTKNDNFIVHFSKRLREERKKLKISQVEAADLCGVSRNSWGGYERGQIMPGADVIARFTAIGADLSYLMTGEKTVGVKEDLAVCKLRPDQSALLDNVEHCSEEDKKAIQRMALSLASFNRDDNDQETEPKKVSGS